MDLWELERRVYEIERRCAIVDQELRVLKRALPPIQMGIWGLNSELPNQPTTPPPTPIFIGGTCNVPLTLTLIDPLVGTTTATYSSGTGPWFWTACQTYAFPGCTAGSGAGLVPAVNTVVVYTLKIISITSAIVTIQYPKGTTNDALGSPIPAASSSCNPASWPNGAVSKVCNFNFACNSTNPFNGTTACLGSCSLWCEAANTITIHT